MVDSRWFGYGGGGSYRAADPDGEAAYRGFRGQLGHGAQPVTGALRGAKAEPEPAAIMNLGVVMQPAGAVSYIDEGDRR
jgi:hypothetical protein